MGLEEKIRKYNSTHNVDFRVDWNSALELEQAVRDDSAEARRGSVRQYWGWKATEHDKILMQLRGESDKVTHLKKYVEQAYGNYKEELVVMRRMRDKLNDGYAMSPEDEDLYLALVERHENETAERKKARLASSRLERIEKMRSAVECDDIATKMDVKAYYYYRYVLNVNNDELTVEEVDLYNKLCEQCYEIKLKK